MKNKIIYCPEAFQDLYFQGPRLERNQVTILGSFDFVRNEGQSVTGTPIEIYRLPEGIPEYANDLEQYKRQRAKREAHDKTVESGERRLASRTRSAKSFVEALSAMKDGSLLSLEASRKAAAALVQTQYVAPTFSQYERNAIQEAMRNRVASDCPRLKTVDLAVDDGSSKDTTMVNDKQTLDPPDRNSVAATIEAKEPGASGPAAMPGHELDPLLKIATNWKRDDLNQLTSVAFHERFVTDEAIAVLAQQLAITNLHFANATFSTSQLEKLNKLVNVQTAAFWGSNIEPSGVAVVCESFPKLKYLSIASTKGLTDESAASIGRLQNLGRLAVGWCGATDKQLEAFVKLPRLHTLKVEGGRLTFGGLIKLRDCKSLRELDISGNSPPLNQKQKRGLQQALPDVSIIF
ncbi:MAG: hypothetical protein AAF664_12450 [Planctomycetota bacterium]